jgi:hypothetical protein
VSRTTAATQSIRVPEYAFPGPCSVSFWAKAPSPRTTQTVVWGQFGLFRIERTVFGDWRWARAYSGASAHLSVYEARWRWSAAAVNVDVTQWHHYAFVHVGGLHTPILYVDGAAKPFTVDTVPTGVLAPSWASPLYLLNNDAVTTPFEGAVHALAIYGAVLTRDEVLRAGSVQRYPLPGLVAFYPLDTAPARDAASGTRGAIADTSAAGEDDPLVTLRYWEVPAGVNVTRLATQLQITWPPIPGAAGYTVEYQVQGSGSSWTALQTSGPAITLTGLTANTTYNVRISTRSTVQASAPSTPFPLSTLSGATPVFLIPPAWDHQPLQLTIRDRPGGRVLLDLSRIVTDLVIEDDMHGCAALAGDAPMDLADAVPLVASGSGAHIQAAIDGAVIASARLEEPGVRDGSRGAAFSFTGYGYQQAFDDLPVFLNTQGARTRAVIEGLVALIRADNPDQLAPVAVFAEDPNTLAPVPRYDGERMRTVLDGLVSLGDTLTPPRRWIWSVWADRVLTVSPIDAYARQWFVEAGSFEATQALKQQFSRVRVRYDGPVDTNGFAARTPPALTARTPRIIRETLLESRVTTLAEATRERDIALSELADPLPQARIVPTRLMNRSRARVPLYSARANDVITIVDFAPTLDARVDRFRTFRIVHRRWNVLSGSVELTVESPLPALDWLLARRRIGV